jgi:hypothetical protein
MRSALFWDMKQRVVYFLTDVSGQRVGPIFKTLEDGKENLARHAGKEFPPHPV